MPLRREHPTNNQQTQTTGDSFQMKFIFLTESLECCFPNDSKIYENGNETSQSIRETNDKLIDSRIADDEYVVNVQGKLIA